MLREGSTQTLFNVAGLLREPVGATRSYTIEPGGPVRSGSVEFVRLPGGVLVRCEAVVRVAAECSRCLKPFETSHPVQFEEIYAQQVDLSGFRLPAPDDPESFLIGVDHTIDITEALRQYTEMAAAMQPLCQPECPGICAGCGEDLAAGSCSCDVSPADHRWEALAKLKLPAHG